MEARPDEIRYVTGANAAYFPMLCALMNAFRLCSHGPRLWVADFGLSEPQKAFLRRYEGTLLEKPAFGEGDVHPFFYKASLADYLEHAGLDCDVLAWIDCDALVVGSLTREVEARVARLPRGERFVAVCPDARGSVGSHLAAFPAEPFRRLFEEHALSLERQYLNTGVMLIRHASLLAEWGRRTRSIEFHTLFEQNVFNFLAHRGPGRIELLDPQVWNVHDRDLDGLVVEPVPAPSPPRVRLGAKLPLIVHATSSDGRRVWEERIEIRLDGSSFHGQFRFVRNEPVQRLFLGSLRMYLERHQRALVELGVAA